MYRSSQGLMGRNLNGNNAAEYSYTTSLLPDFQKGDVVAVHDDLTAHVDACLT